MNGPEHYSEAERLLGMIQNPTREYLASLTDDPAALGNDLALAQVHATLALAAATAETVIDNGPNTTVGVAWAKAVD